jgi:hypothetical protein
MTQSDKTTTHNDTYTMQAADPTELEQVEGGLELTPIYAFRPNPNGDGFSVTPQLTLNFSAGTT